jgi:primase-polymerase (primpol)-like protein
MNKENVGNWSAGCQVIAGGFSGKEWTEFYKNCQMATNLPIPYLLVNETDIPELLGV